MGGVEKSPAASHWPWKGLLPRAVMLFLVLPQFSLCLTIVFLLQLAAGILGFVFSDKVTLGAWRPLGTRGRKGKFLLIN